MSPDAPPRSCRAARNAQDYSALAAHVRESGCCVAATATTGRAWSLVVLAFARHLGRRRPRRRLVVAAGRRRRRSPSS